MCFLSIKKSISAPYFFFEFPRRYGFVFPTTSTKIVSSPIFIICLSGMKSSQSPLKTFQKLLSPGTTIPSTHPFDRLKTMSTMCPSLFPSITFTTSLHLSSRYVVSIQNCMSHFVRKCHYSKKVLIDFSAFFSRRETCA